MRVVIFSISIALVSLLGGCTGCRSIWSDGFTEVSGAVVTERGDGIAGARITLQSDGLYATPIELTSDSAGHFHFFRTSRPRSRPLELAVRKEGYRDATMHLLSGKKLDVKVTLGDLP
jgi:hypothetical protein